MIALVGGWDPSAKAGLAMDLRVATAFGAACCAVVTTITAQPIARVSPVSDEMLASQLDAIGDVDIVKLGLVGSPENAAVIARWLGERDAFVICDPVLRATSGVNLWSGDGVAALRALLPHVDLLTPNLDEAEALLDTRARTDEEIDAAAEALRALGAGAVVVKGGHGDGATLRDRFVGDERAWLVGDRRPDARGTGCALATAIACAWAWGPSRVDRLLDAVVVGSAHVRHGLAHTLGTSSWPAAALPRLDPVSIRFSPADALGFYPIVERATDVATVAALGVRTVQLRIKDLHGETLSREIAAAVAATRGTSCRLVANDHLALAVEHGAWGVHLGQEDLAATSMQDLERLATAGLALGISTHSYAELARALGVQPSYVALGPVYETTLKSMRYPPQGPSRIAEWQALTTIPVVAIGGITLERLDEVRHADGVCVVGDVRGRLESRTRAYLERLA